LGPAQPDALLGYIDNHEIRGHRNVTLGVPGPDSRKSFAYGIVRGWEVSTHREPRGDCEFVENIAKSLFRRMRAIYHILQGCDSARIIGPVGRRKASELFGPYLRRGCHLMD